MQNTVSEWEPACRFIIDNKPWPPGTALILIIYKMLWHFREAPQPLAQIVVFGRNVALWYYLPMYLFTIIYTLFYSKSQPFLTLFWAFYPTLQSLWTRYLVFSNNQHDVERYRCFTQGFPGACSLRKLRCYIIARSKNDFSTGLKKPETLQDQTNGPKYRKSQSPDSNPHTPYNWDLHIAMVRILYPLFRQ